MIQPDTYTLDELYDHCVRNGYPEHAQTLQGYIDKRAEEKADAGLTDLFSKPTAFTGQRSAPGKAWKEVLASRREAA